MRRWAGVSAMERRSLVVHGEANFALNFHGFDAHVQLIISHSIPVQFQPRLDCWPQGLDPQEDQTLGCVIGLE